MKIDSDMLEEERQGWRVVRLDSFADIPGQILSADDQTGEVKMKNPRGEERSYSLGQHAIRLIRR
jgi:hypothetical protein